MYDPFARGTAPVGVRTIELCDESRAGRRLTVELWYPATEAYRGQDLGDARDRYPIAPGLPDDMQDAVRGAEPAEGHFPLILCSHGANGHRRVNAALCTHLASHGYIVVSNDVPGNTIADVMRDADAEANGAAATRPSQDEVNLQRPRDAAFVIESIVAGAEPALAPYIDPGRVGACGHSSGGWTTLALNSVDLRPKASFVMAPLWGKNKLVPQIARVAARLRLDDWKRPVPTFMLAGERDAFILLDDLRDLYSKLLPPKRFAVLHRAGHEHFHDDAELYHDAQRQMYLSDGFPDPEINAPALAEAMRPFSELCPAGHGLDTMRALCLAHMDQHLKGSAEAGAFLDGDLASTFAARGIGLEIAAPFLGDPAMAEGLPAVNLPQAHRITRETFEFEAGRLVVEVKRIVHEGNVRRIVVKQGERVIVEFPLAVGVVGTLLAAPLAALGALAALLNDCTIEVEREELTPVAVLRAPEEAAERIDAVAVGAGQATGHNSVPVTVPLE